MAEPCTKAKARWRIEVKPHDPSQLGWISPVELHARMDAKSPWVFVDNFNTWEDAVAQMEVMAGSRIGFFC